MRYHHGSNMTDSLISLTAAACVVHCLRRNYARSKGPGRTGWEMLTVIRRLYPRLVPHLNLSGSSHWASTLHISTVGITCRSQPLDALSPRSSPRGSSLCIQAHTEQFERTNYISCIYILDSRSSSPHVPRDRLSRQRGKQINTFGFDVFSSG